MLDGNIRRMIAFRWKGARLRRGIPEANTLRQPNCFLTKPGLRQDIQQRVQLLGLNRHTVAMQDAGDAAQSVNDSRW